MSTPAAQMELQIRRKVMSALTQQQLRRIADKSRKVIVKMIIDRIYRGYDLEGRKFGGYNRSYDKSYAFSYVTGGVNSPIASKYFRAPTEHQSKSEPLRLSGQLLSNIQVDLKTASVLSSQIKVVYRVYVPKKFEEQVIGLQSTTGTARNGSTYSKKAWTFMGLSKQLGEDVKLMEYFINEIKGLMKSGSFKQKGVK